MKNKIRQTELNLTILTDDEYKDGDGLENTRQKIERAAMYLMSIFNLMKVCSINYEGQSESREMSGFFEDINNHCDIGYGIADSVMASSAASTEFIPDEKAEIEENAAPNFDSFFDEKYKQTGERLERALASSNLSNDVKNVLEALVNEVANEAGFSFPEPDEIALKLPKIFDALGKQKSPFTTYFNAIETALNHGTNGKEI